MSRFIGDIVRIKATFYDEDGDPADPEALLLTVKPPADDAVEFDDLVQESTGVWYQDYEIEAAGLHEYRIEATGATLTKVYQGSFYVEPSNVG